jgi:hypothetical protein
VSWTIQCPRTPGSSAQRGCLSTGSSFWRRRGRLCRTLCKKSQQPIRL